MVNKDAILAQKIVGLTYSNNKDTLFHNESSIYVKSNEKIIEYLKYLYNRRDVLSVISSSDQIINMILGGSINIDAFDISTFPKYYMYLKLAGIMSLNRSEYIDFFYRVDKRPEEYDDLYFDLIRKELDSDSKEFWDSIINFYDWNDIVNSTLFSSEPICVGSVVENNTYLTQNSFDSLKDLIPKTNITTYQGNILDIYKEFNKKYNLIYLSNIIYYVDRSKYKEMLDSLRLSDNGIVLTYLYSSLDQIRDYFNKDNYSVETLSDGKSGLLIKKK